jgi:signal transduction histidine kinase
MKSLYLRIYLTVVAAVALFALVSGWFVQRHLDEQRGRADVVARERTAAWGELLQRALPPAQAPVADQAMALRDWSQRLRMPLALDDAQGKRLASSDSFIRREFDGPQLTARAQALRWDDGRTLWVPRPGGAGRGPAPAAGAGLGNEGPGARGPRALSGPGGPETAWAWPWPGTRMGLPAGWPDGLSLALLLLLLFVAVAGGAWPVVRRLTRRLEALKQGVDAFGAGALAQRVAEDGRDEVATLGASFNRAAARIEALVQSHQSLLANASHELRSPLARLKMALALSEDVPASLTTEVDAQRRAALRQEINTNIAELDALVEEVLLASRLNASTSNGATVLARQAVDLLGLAAEEAAAVGAGVGAGVGAAVGAVVGAATGAAAGAAASAADSPAAAASSSITVSGSAVQVWGDERLLRRAVRNLLENARRYGGTEVQVIVAQLAIAQRGPQAELRVCDRGPGVPEPWRERIFEAFFRLPGHAEHAGGVGLGLALVRQIAQRHGGQVRCEAREGGGSVFVLTLPCHT